LILKLVECGAGSINGFLKHNLYILYGGSLAIIAVEVVYQYGTSHLNEVGLSVVKVLGGAEKS
jgi:hypothetical protein